MDSGGGGVSMTALDGTDENHGNNVNPLLSEWSTQQLDGNDARPSQQNVSETSEDIPHFHEIPYRNRIQLFRRVFLLHGLRALVMLAIVLPFEAQNPLQHPYLFIAGILACLGSLAGVVFLGLSENTPVIFMVLVMTGAESSVLGIASMWFGAAIFVTWLLIMATTFFSLTLFTAIVPSFEGKGPFLVSVLACVLVCTPALAVVQGPERILVVIVFVHSVFALKHITGDICDVLEGRVKFRCRGTSSDAMRGLHFFVMRYSIFEPGERYMRKSRKLATNKNKVAIVAATTAASLAANKPFDCEV